MKTINFHVTCYRCNSKITPMQDLELKTEQLEKEILHVNFHAFPCDNCIKELAMQFADGSIKALGRDLDLQLRELRKQSETK